MGQFEDKKAGGTDTADRNDKASTISAPTEDSALESTGSLKRASAGARSSRPKVAQVADIVSLLSRFYVKPFGPTNVTASDLAVLQNSSDLQPEERSRLLEAASADRTLERTRKLLFLCVERLRGHGAEREVINFVRSVLSAHPAFQTPGFVRLLEGRGEGPDEEHATQILADRPFYSLPWPADSPKLTKREAAQCRSNSFVCLMLLLRRSIDTSPELLLHCFQNSVWKPKSGRPMSGWQRFKTLLIARDGNAVSVACDLLNEQLATKMSDAVAARKAEEKAIGDARQTKAALVELQSQFERAQAEATALTEQLQSEKQEREMEGAHFRDDYQKLRGRLLQRLKEETSLLGEGLQALQREPPKVHVMLDHAERVMDNLKLEIRRLQGDE